MSFKIILIGLLRIKQCTEITEQEFVVAHHEMGHIEYFLQYKDQPFKFREGANDGFHEAIGDLIALSVTSSKHLKRIGLLPNEPDNPKKVLNALFKVCIFCFLWKLKYKMLV